MIRLRPALWPTLVSLPILVLSLSLGIWQMERREWKRDILDRIATNQAAAPMTLDQLLSGDPLRHEYGRVKVAGTFEHGREFFLAARSLPTSAEAVGRAKAPPLRRAHLPHCAGGHAHPTIFTVARTGASPSAFIRDASVVGLMSSRAAAPLAPNTLPLHAFSAA